MIDKLEEIEKIVEAMATSCFYLSKELHEIQEHEACEISKSCDEDYYKIKKIISELRESI